MSRILKYMNVKYLRSSSVTTYEDCQFKYFLEYVLNLPSPSGKKAMLGTIVHHVLELLAKASKINRTGKILDTEYLLHICWSRYIGELEGMELGEKDYKFCQKTINKVIDSPYNPSNLKVIDTEKRFQIPVNGESFSYNSFNPTINEIETGNCELRGTMDLVTEIDKDTLEVIDWKTGLRKCWSTGKEKDYSYLFDNDIQLRMYDLACSILYPQYKHRLMTVHFINKGGPFTVAFDDSEREKTLKVLNSHFSRISNNQCPSRIKEDKPKSSWKCRNVCHFGKSKASNGNCWCDNIFYYLLHNGIDKTILKVEELKNKERNSKKTVALTSNRRNVY
jgi:ferredoxin-thioredoxin reductase catalytic subunit